MKFLIDRCVSKKIAAWLETQGHDARHAAELGPDPRDAALLAIARREDRLLITADQDFSRLLYADHAAHAGVLYLPDISVKRHSEYIAQVLHEHTESLNRRALVTIRKSGVIIISNPPPPAGTNPGRTPSP